MTLDPTISVVIAVLLLAGLIAIRAPLFVALGFAGFVGLYLLQGLTGVAQIPLTLTGQLANFTLTAIPLYILMGEVLAVTGLGRDLFETGYKWLNRVPGSLGTASVTASTMFGAMSGVSLSGVAVVGRMAVPAMLARGYQPSFASGSVVASGALAMLIPPSLPFILYSAITGVSVAKLFAGGVIPGLLLAALMGTYIVMQAVRRPELAPRTGEHISWSEKLGSLVRILPAILLILLVLGAMYTGLATPTEAAAVGALGAFAIGGLIYRALNRDALLRILVATTQVSCSMLAIVAAAFIFTKVLVNARVPENLTGFVAGFDVPPYVVMLMIMIVLVGLGCLVDAASLLLVVTPVLVPVVSELGFSPLWFGVLLVMNLEMAVITPPVGLNLYAMKSVVPSLQLTEIIRGIWPYVGLEFAFLMLMMAVPGISLWLPSTVG